jgi:tetratricopeptide (TPR) repeat protein
VRLAEAYSHTGDYAQSNATYDSIATLFGDAIQITAGKLNNYQAMNDSTGALNEMRHLLYKAPKNADYNIAMSNLFQHYGMTDSAFYYLDRAQEYEPDNGAVYLVRARYYQEAGDSLEYEQQIFNALTAEQLDVDTKLGVLLSFIQVQLAKEDTTQRINNLFTALIEQHPHEAKIHQLYSEYLYTLKDYKGAIEQLGYSLDVNPTDADGWRNMVILNMMDDNYADAIKASDKALEYNPDNLDLYRYVAGCYHQMKSYSKAIFTYMKILELTDSTDVEQRSDVYTGMGDTYSELGDTAKAVECYKQALELNPINSGALNNYAYFLAQRGEDLDNAERMAALAIKDEPNNANFIDTYAWVYFAKKDYTKALLYIKSAVEKDEENHLLEHYGDILWFNDEKEQAVEQWTKALETDPDNELLQRKVKDKTYYEE